MKLIDSHTHLYSEDFNKDIESVMQRAFDANVQKFYLPAIDSSTHEAMLALEEKYPQNCFAMMGLHPCNVNENFEKELNIIKEYLDKRNFAAVGEIGLDFYWDISYKNEQFKAFEQQMQWALDRQLPIAIHSRNSMKETIVAVEPFAEKGLKGIFHCFGGTIEEANKIISLGFLLGIGGILTYKKANLDAVLKEIDLEHIVMETDAPYLTPVPFRGKRNESSYLQYIAQAIANCKNITLEEVANITSTNAEKLFAIK